MLRNKTVAHVCGTVFHLDCGLYSVVDCHLGWVPGFVLRPDSSERSERRALAEDLAPGYPNHPNHLP